MERERKRETRTYVTGYIRSEDVVQLQARPGRGGEAFNRVAGAGASACMHVSIYVDAVPVLREAECSLARLRQPLLCSEILRN